MRIACVLAEGFEDSEFRVPFDAFKQAGHQVDIIGLKKGEKIKGKNGKESTTVDRAIGDAQARDYDALFIPGGHSPDQLRADDKVVEFTRTFVGRPIFAICHGPQLLLTADMVRGKTMTAWKTIQFDLKLAGAQVVDREVVVDGGMVTSRKPEDLEAFCREAVAQLKQVSGHAHA